MRSDLMRATVTSKRLAPTLAALAVLALAGLGTLAAAPAPAFRIGVIATAAGPCAPPPPSTPAAERAYFDLLAKRLDRDVLACPVASYADGAAGLAAGRLDMAVVDAASYPAVRSTVRATMTVRADGALARVPVVLAVKAGHDGSPGALQGRAIGFGGSAAVALALPRQVLAEQGYVGRDVVTTNETAALTALRAGQVDAIALQAAAWQRQCQSPSPKVRPCADLKRVWAARPQAQRAFAVRRDLADPLRFRLLGVHVAMHLEDRSAFAWAAAQLAPGAAEFQPAEALALEPGRLP
jgi:ABC-type phosphate/phosphonate transport system substrate-binding protein